MGDLFWRIIIAVVALVLVFALLPPLVELSGLNISSPLLTIIRICAVGIAAFYILTGRKPVS